MIYNILIYKKKKFHIKLIAVIPLMQYKQFQFQAYFDEHWDNIVNRNYFRQK